MPTENPKISAYVPQIVYARFKQYQEERQLSMSQAAIEILAHYFELNLESSDKEFTGGLPSRLNEIEQSLKELRKLYTQLAFKVDHTQTTSEPLDENTLNSVDQRAPVISEPQGEPESSIPNIVTSEPLSELESKAFVDKNESENKSELPSNLKSELPKEQHSEVPVQLNLVDSPSDSLSSSLKESSLSAIKLGERLSISRNTLGTHRKKDSVEEFANMTSQKDPDGIKWVYLEKLKSYVPYGDLSLEQVKSLKSWKNQQSTK